MFEFFKSDKKGNDEKGTQRIELETDEQWAEVIEMSHEHAVYIFKHSSNCGISSMVLRRFEKQLKERNESYFYVHIQRSRDLSNWIAQQLGIRHESPQLIVLKKGKVSIHSSHYALLEILPDL